MIGDRIKQERKARGWKIRDLEERSGISGGYLRLLETNQRPNPTSDTLTALAAAFEIPVDDLLQSVGPDPAQPPITLLKAAGQWSEEAEQNLRRAWPAMSPRMRIARIARLQRLAALQAEYKRLEVEYHSGNDDSGSSAGEIPTPVHVILTT